MIPWSHPGGCWLSALLDALSLVGLLPPSCPGPDVQVPADQVNRWQQLCGARVGVVSRRPGERRVWQASGGREVRPDPRDGKVPALMAVPGCYWGSPPSLTIALQPTELLAICRDGNSYKLTLTALTAWIGPLSTALQQPPPFFRRFLAMESSGKPLILPLRLLRSIALQELTGSLRQFPRDSIAVH